LAASLFSDEIRELFEVLEKAHNNYKKDISTAELFALWKNENPVATRAEVDTVQKLLYDISTTEEMSDEVTSDIIDGLWKREIGRKIGALGIAISEGRPEAFDRLKKLLSDVSDGFKPDDFGELITDDILELLAITSDENRWKININTLSSRVYGPGPGDFVIVFARPETGKTAFAVSLAASPDGWADQGAKVMYLVNEEDARRTKLRAVMAYTGLTKEQIIADTKVATDTYSAIASNLIMKGIHDWDTIKVEAFIEEHKPDIVIVDQLDKVFIQTNSEVKHEVLGDLYIWGRGLAVRHNCVVVAVSQSSIDGEGKTILTPDMMEGSKTRKYAEGDLIMGLGKFPDPQDGSPNPLRFVTVGKNKINGWHGTEIVKLEASISRYVE
jgi:KaiC/GvpD/RAD55 family RecA-like ATPase